MCHALGSRGEVREWLNRAVSKTENALLPPPAASGVAAPQAGLPQRESPAGAFACSRMRSDPLRCHGRENGEQTGNADERTLEVFPALFGWSRRDR